MVEPPAATRHALAPAAMERAHAGRPLAARMGQGLASTRRHSLRHAAKPLRGNAYNSGGLAPATLAPNAEIDTWEEY